MKIKICESGAAFEAEPFLKPFGFKGKKLTGVWQTVVGLASENEIGIGLGIESPLWSDGSVFAAKGEAESNRLMFAVTEFAAGLVKWKEYSSPEEILDDIFEDCLEFARKTVSPDVTETFVLNALVPLDMAATSVLKCTKMSTNLSASRVVTPRFIWEAAAIPSAKKRALTGIMQSSFLPARGTTS